MRLLFFDLETTGLNPKINDVIEIGGQVFFDTELIEEFCFQVQPFKRDIKKIVFTPREGAKIAFSAGQKVKVFINANQVAEVPVESTVGLSPFKVKLGSWNKVHIIEESAVVMKREWGPIEEEALKVNKITRGELVNFPKPKEVVEKLVKVLSKHHGGMEDPLILCGHNINDFDLPFMKYFISRGSFFDLELFFGKNRSIDTLDMAKYAKAKGILKGKRNSLSAVCKELDVEYKNAHRALIDVQANSKMFFKLDELITSSNSTAPTSQMNLFK